MTTSSDEPPVSGNISPPWHLQPDTTVDSRRCIFWAALATRFFLTSCMAGSILPIATLAAAGSQLEIHYAPRENLETVDVREIGRAELSIDMAAYVLSDRQIIEALTDAAERDVVIRLYLDKSQFAEHGPVRGDSSRPRLPIPMFSRG